MELSAFITGLFNEGVAMVGRDLSPHGETDRAEACRLIAAFYAHDRQEMPGDVPPLTPDAALWAAGYLYRAVQLVLLRDLDDSTVISQLRPYTGLLSPSAIYSADLVLRHLSTLFKLSSGLAPGDLLVVRLQDTAAHWPFSSVGLGIIPAVPLTPILDHPSLRIIYGDRIIRTRDRLRTTGAPVQALLTEIMGIHHHLFWPSPEPVIEAKLTL